MWRFTYNHVYCYVNLIIHTSYWVYGHQGVGVHTIILLIHLWSQVRLVAMITSQLILALYDVAIYYN